MRKALAGCIEFLEHRRLLSNSWFVAPWGNDSGPGTLVQPFRTVQQAGGTAQTGDTVLIRTGTYRETIHPAHSGVTFKPFNGESVTVSGTDLVSGWTNAGGSIYQTAASWDLGEGNNQVFVDGKMANEARWPNPGPDLSHPVEAKIGSFSNSTLYDSTLTQPAGFWTGATIRVIGGDQWVAYTGTVTNSGPGWLKVSLPNLGAAYEPLAGNPYDLSGRFQALAAPNEFYQDNSGNLYLWTSNGDDPSSHTIEVKHRQYAFDLSGVSNATIDGIHIFGATIHTDAASVNTLIDHTDAQYVTQFSTVSDQWSPPGPRGIELNGAGSVLENSTIAYSAGDGAFIGSSNVSVINNVIHDVDYSGTDAAPVRVTVANATVNGNTIYNAGRDGINLRASAATVLSNTIHDVMLQTDDGGGIYTCSIDGQGSTIAYNAIYNVQPPSQLSWADGTGIMLDNDSSNFIVHDNTTWNVGGAIKLNFTSRNEQVYNNQFGATRYAVESNSWPGSQYDWSGTQFYNNTFYNQNLLMGLHAVQWGNRFASGSPALSMAPPAAADIPQPSASSYSFADLVRLAASYGRIVPAGTAGDLNGDGTVNFLDLVALGDKYRNA